MFRFVTNCTSGVCRCSELYSKINKFLFNLTALSWSMAKSGYACPTIVLDHVRSSYVSVMLEMYCETRHETI